MCNALTVTKRKSAPLPERLCERIAYCAILLTVYEADYSVVVAQSEGADHRYYSTPEMQNILLQNVVGHAVRKAKNFAGGVTDAILSGRQVLINLMSDFVLDKTKATGGGRQWENTKHKPEHHSDLLAGGQCDQCAGLLVGYQPFGSIPRRFSSALANSLNQLPRVRPSEVAASFTCWRSSLLILIWKVGDHPSPRGDLSRFNVDMYVRNSYYHCCYVRTISVGTVKSKAPQVSLPLAGLLTTNDNESIEVAMLNHTTHPQGRDSHNLNKYIWRFIALSTAQPRVIHIEATSEQEARQQSPDGCVMVFAARIRQEVEHV
ncbi:putative prophage protein [Escherichia coli]|uniref:Putative prophage protein n=2 Tax=Escherichia coli TaxID=562 RepID=A0A2Y8MR43_ECOLX|nr:putative prophage protein [Escherichia coli]SRY48242.1 putative prophage protein [Escherichia coli]